MSSVDTRRFSGFAKLYSVSRPQPPKEASEVVLQYLRKPRSDLTVDLGAGTGLSTAIWRDHSARVVGIEPTPDMIRQCRGLRSAEIRRPGLVPGPGSKAVERRSRQNRRPDRAIPANLPAFQAEANARQLQNDPCGQVIGPSGHERRFAHHGVADALVARFLVRMGRYGCREGFRRIVVFLQKQADQTVSAIEQLRGPRAVRDP